MTPPRPPSVPPPNTALCPAVTWPLASQIGNRAISGAGAPPGLPMLPTSLDRHHLGVGCCAGAGGQGFSRAGLWVSPGGHPHRPLPTPSLASVQSSVPNSPAERNPHPLVMCDEPLCPVGSVLPRNEAGSPGMATRLLREAKGKPTRETA